MGEGLLTWTLSRGLTAEPESVADGPLLVADSWLVRDGRVRGYGRHRERFLRACAEYVKGSDGGGSGPRRLVQFWQDVTAALPRTGEWFPRVELTAGSLELRLRLRHAPPLGTAIRLWSVGQPDRRTAPRRKGPDLDVLARVRERAIDEGAQDGMLVDPSGAVLESATASVLWWEDDTLCQPPPRLPHLPGVTAALIQERALHSGIRTAHRERTVTELAGREVWLVNALHGIRPVTGWTGEPMTAGPAVRAEEWRRWLDELPEPLPNTGNP
ncbi:aminotransferase class IV [Streptomyces sp. NBC_01485]|uniref:aminotransferase class IV n=1 Tax=Streptomyces sp. NBC_01485 TaxID=2903884 RepID=UPI002E32AEB3|nr:aminotransferase class IV [Streptomyces sp. NBC_01485]